MVSNRDRAYSGWRAWLRELIIAVFTAVLVLALATLLNRDAANLADRVDRNAEVTRNEVSAVICVLRETDPALRTDAYIESCLEANSVDPDTVSLPIGEEEHTNG